MDGASSNLAELNRCESDSRRRTAYCATSIPPRTLDLMKWPTRTRRPPEGVDDRWNGVLDPAEWDALFGDRMWLTNRSWQLPVWSDGRSQPGVATADLAYEQPSKRSDEWPPRHDLPTRATPVLDPPIKLPFEQPSRCVIVLAGTPVQILGCCIFEDQRFYEDVLYTWTVGDQILCADVPARGTQSLASALVSALVVPAISPLATAEAGALLLRRASDLASEAWAHASEAWVSLPPHREWVPPLSHRT